MRHVPSLSSALTFSLLAGCTTLISSAPDFTGKIDGAVTLAWEDTTKYVYLPKTGDRLTYVIPEDVRLSGDDTVNNDNRLRTIRPGRMYTDGGSIPRIFWSTEGLSPLDYLPAYVIHDWLYMQNRCHKPHKGPFGEYKTFPYSRLLADNILKDSLLLIDQKRKRSPAETERARNMISKAVSSFGEKAWRSGSCVQPPPETYEEQPSVFQPTFARKARVERSRYSEVVTISVD